MKHTKKRFAVALLAGLLLTPLSVYGAGDDFYAEVKASKDSALPDGVYILDLKSADVTGDNVADDILLVGRQKTRGGGYADHISVIVRDGMTKSRKTPEIGSTVSGYEGRIFIGDFNGDKISDVMLTVATGGSGGIVSNIIATFNKADPEVIFDAENNKGARFTGRFADGFKAELESLDTERTLEYDLASRKDNYVAIKLYDEDGRLLQQRKPTADAFSSLQPVDLDHDGTYELKGVQRISAAYHADGIGNAYSTWKYETGTWKMKQLEVSAFL